MHCVFMYLGCPAPQSPNFRETMARDIVGVTGSTNSLPRVARYWDPIETGLGEVLKVNEKPTSSQFPADPCSDFSHYFLELSQYLPASSPQYYPSSLSQPAARVCSIFHPSVYKSDMVVRFPPLPATLSPFISLPSVFPTPCSVSWVTCCRSGLPALSTGTRDWWLLILLS